MKVTIVVEVSGAQAINTLVTQIKQVSDVISVKRV